MKKSEELENSRADADNRASGSTAQIRDALKKVEADVTCVAPDKRLDKVLKVLKKKDKKDSKDSKNAKNDKKKKDSK